MEERRFAAALRSVLALSLATPAALFVACAREDLFPPVSRDEPDATADATVLDAADADAPLEPRCEVPEAGTFPPVAWEGGVWEGNPWPSAANAGLGYDYPDGSVGCGLANLPVGHRTCRSYAQFPCCQPPVLPLPLSGPSAEYPIADCRAHCEDTADRPVQGRHAERDVNAAPGSSPYLVCDYCKDDSPTVCGSVQVPGNLEPNPCGWNTQLPCGTVPLSTPAGVELEAGVCARCFADGDDRVDSGTYQLTRCATARNERGALYLHCYVGCPGRQPAGLVVVEPARGAAVGAWLADASHLEAASVDAFALLADDLRAHGAPASLVARAQRAEADEVRHARITAKLARRFGALEGEWAAPVRRHASEARTLEAIAHENAVEGCVKETFAAVLAMWQAEHARDEAVRAAMSVIAEDEARHAALAWSVLAWARAKLGPSARDRVEAALRSELATLVRASRIAAPRTLVDAGLLPDGARAERLAVNLAAALERELAA